MLLAQTFTVTNTLDDGSTGSLRWAINSVNADIGLGVDTIAFNIPDPGVHTIAVGSPLPPIRHPVAIDGYTQPGSSPNNLAVGDNAVLEIELDGSAAGVNATGLTLQGSDSVVRGLVINSFARHGIDVQDNLTMIAGNFIGTDPTGTIPQGNGLDGILLTGSADRIGSPSPADRNILAANSIGLQVVDPAQENTIQGNYIGVDATGLHPLGNNLHEGIGIEFDLSSGNVVGGTAPGAGNVISGNANFGILNLFSLNNNITGNFIGADATGMAALGNGLDGIFIVDSSETTVQGNLISGNGRAGWT